jgi:Transposase DNA-binding/Transposase Tn5 dimerisation domain
LRSNSPLCPSYFVRSIALWARLWDEFFRRPLRRAGMTAGRSEAGRWAEAEFGDAALGDTRRTMRLVRMAARAAENPSGKLSAVFSTSKELDGAYDFVESEKLSVALLETAVGRSAARRCVGQGRVRVAVDGSSLTLTEGPKDKGFGPIGCIAAGWQGLKVISALALGADGVPIGLLAQSWWARPEAPPRTLKQSKRDRMRKKPHEKETGRWLETIERSAERLAAAGALGWFQLDREADAWPLLFSLSRSGHWFTVRSAWDRLLADSGRDKQYLRARMAVVAPLGSYELDVPARWGRQARRAHMVIYAAEQTLLLREKMNGKRPRPLTVRVVWTHERGTTPAAEEPLDWMLLTNAPIDSFEAARDVVVGYSMRWRIEEFHRTWKTGGCNVELTQLRSRDAVIRWATILAVVAARIERLKRLGREQPDRPATDELSAVEVQVLVVLKRRQKKRTESVPDGVPTIAQATRWIADLGGFTGKSSGGPPGSITIGRGLERLRHGVEAVLAMRNAEK